MEGPLDTGLSPGACRRADKGKKRECENILELPGAEEAQSYFQEGCPGSQLTLNPYQQVQTRLPIEAGELGLPSRGARRVYASIRSRVWTLPEALADLTGPL